MEEKDVVTTENFEGEHIYTFLLTPHKHDMPKLVLLHQYDYVKLSYFTNLVVVLLHQLGRCKSILLLVKLVIGF
jgi:hypothetical protein